MCKSQGPGLHGCKQPPATDANRWFATKETIPTPAHGCPERGSRPMPPERWARTMHNLTDMHGVQELRDKSDKPGKLDPILGLAASRAEYLGRIGSHRGMSGRVSGRAVVKTPAANHGPRHVPVISHCPCLTCHGQANSTWKNKAYNMPI